MSGCRCRVYDLKHKEVINIKNGVRIGCVDDVEIDTAEAVVIALVIHGRRRLFGLLGREDDCLIHWKHIEIMGEDTILVSFDGYNRSRRRVGLISKLWG